MAFTLLLFGGLDDITLHQSKKRLIRMAEQRGQ
jgi:hypothetical protein